MCSRTSDSNERTVKFTNLSRICLVSSNHRITVANPVFLYASRDDYLFAPSIEKIKPSTRLYSPPLCHLIMPASSSAHSTIQPRSAPSIPCFGPLSPPLDHRLRCNPPSRSPAAHPRTRRAASPLYTLFATESLSGMGGSNLSSDSFPPLPFLNKLPIASENYSRWLFAWRGNGQL